MSPDPPPLGHPESSTEISAVGRYPLGHADTVRAQRGYWDGVADAYQDINGSFLTGFVWCPEGLTEDEAGLLGRDWVGRDVLEIGCGAAQCAGWLAGRGARVVALDLSGEQLRHATPTPGVRLVQADAARLPVASGSMAMACSAFGGVPFVADSAAVMREAARVLVPGGRWVFSVSHPFRWVFPDDAAAETLLVTQSYFDRTPYVEYSGEVPVYAEHHRTFGDRVREIVAAGLELLDVVEPEWPGQQRRRWGQWSPERGELLPGTAIFVTRKLP